ncbi:MAG: DUF502 domain-containing protein [Acidobacteriota bacterium]|jgi:uncharacterized membrane protein
MQNPDRLSDSMGLPIPKADSGRRPGFAAYLRSRLITGALVALPLVITLFFARFLFNLLDRWSYPISERLVGHAIPGAGAVLAIFLVFTLGVLAHNVFGRRILRFGEAIISRVPLLNSVYLGSREVTRAFSSDRTRSFRRVVLIPYPVEGSWAIAFVTAEFATSTPAGPCRMVSVFMPSTPNPTTGFYMIYPESLVRDTDLTVEEAARMVISGGILAPPPDHVLRPSDVPRT